MMAWFRVGGSGSVLPTFDLRELVSGRRGSWVSDALLQKRFQLSGDFGALAIEVCRLEKVGFQVIELGWRSVRFEFSVFDIAVDMLCEEMGSWTPAFIVGFQFTAKSSAALSIDVDPLAFAKRQIGLSKGA